jgi:hypothetical protein
MAHRAAFGTYSASASAAGYGSNDVVYSGTNLALADTCGALVDPAVDVGQECVRGGGVRGLAHNALLAGVCTTQCLSNRPDGCT